MIGSQMQAMKVESRLGDRSLTGKQPDAAATLRNRRIVLANPVLLMYRRQIDTAVFESKKTRHGLPTDLAIIQRWWIQDFRPPRGDRGKLGRMLYAGSFECCCEMLSLDVDAERRRLLAEIDDAIVRAMTLHAGNITYARRAAVLRCAGVPTAVGRQYVLGLVHPDDYDDVADPAEVKAIALADKRLARESAQTSRRSRRRKAA